MRNVNIYAYKAGSASAKALAQEMGVKRIAHRNSKYKGRKTKTVINWGSSTLPEEVNKSVVFNNPEFVAEASNKLKAFERMHEAGIFIPEYTTDLEVAQQWMDGGKLVVARQKLTGHSGEGIVLCGGRAKYEEDEQVQNELVQAPLYVEYIPKQHEYRIHVVGGKVIDSQRKARKEEVENPNWKIRNHGNGFVFARNDGHVIPEAVFTQAEQAVESLGLDFGAVDIVYNRRRETAYVLEVNTACGLEGTTLTKYVEAFTNLIEEAV